MIHVGDVRSDDLRGESSWPKLPLQSSREDCATSCTESFSAPKREHGPANSSSMTVILPAGRPECKHLSLRLSLNRPVSPSYLNAAIDAFVGEPSIVANDNVPHPPTLAMTPSLPKERRDSVDIPVYSYRNASIGSILAARLAGYRPLTTLMRIA